MKLEFGESLGAIEIEPPKLVPSSDDWTGFQEWTRSLGPAAFTLRVKGDPKISASLDVHEFFLGNEQRNVRFQGIVTRIEDVLMDADEDCPPHRFTINLRVDKQLSGMVIPSGGHDYVLTVAA